VATYLHARPEGEPISIVLRRWRISDRKIFDFHIRELPGMDLQFVGDTEHISAEQEE